MKQFVLTLFTITFVGAQILYAQQWIYPANDWNLVATSPDKNFWHVQEVYNELVFRLERNDGTPLFQKKIRLEEPIYLPNTNSNAIYSNPNQLISLVEKEGTNGQTYWLLFEQDTLGDLKTCLRIDAFNFYVTTSTDGSIFISNYQGLTKVRNGVVQWTKAYRETSSNYDLQIVKVLESKNDSLTLFASNTLIRADSMGNVGWSKSYYNFAPPNNGSMFNAWHDVEYNIYFCYVNAIVKLDYWGKVLSVVHTTDVQFAQVLPWVDGSLIGIPYSNIGGNDASVILIDSLYASVSKLSIIDSTQGTLYIKNIGQLPNLVSIDGTYRQLGIYKTFKYTVPSFFDLCYAKSTPIQMQISSGTIVAEPSIVANTVVAPIQGYVTQMIDTVLAPIVPEDFCLLNTFNQIDVADEKFWVYPNPTSGSISVKPTPRQVTIYDNLGNVVVYTSNTSEIDLSNLPNEIYYLKVTSSNKSSFHKFVKQ